MGLREIRASDTWAPTASATTSGCGWSPPRVALVVMLASGVLQAGDRPPSSGWSCSTRSTRCLELVSDMIYGTVPVARADGLHRPVALPARPAVAAFPIPRLLDLRLAGGRGARPGSRAAPRARVLRPADGAPARAARRRSAPADLGRAALRGLALQAAAACLRLGAGDGGALSSRGSSWRTASGCPRSAISRR